MHERDDDGTLASSNGADQDNDVWKIINGAFGLNGNATCANSFGLAGANNSDLVEAITERVTEQVTESMGKHMKQIKIAIVGLTKAVDELRRDIRRNGNPTAPPVPGKRERAEPLNIPLGSTPDLSARQQHNMNIQHLAQTLLNGLGASKTSDSPLVTSFPLRPAEQRRKDMAYKHMKVIGMPITINGIVKTIFDWTPAEIRSAVQAKRLELARQGRFVIFQGQNITDKVYRVDFSKDLVNGRRCGQLLADSLWPRGHFQTHMLMPIMQGVHHRTKKRANGTSRIAIESDEFEVFKVALMLLGGFLMQESDRARWMEAARDGVNQRGLDEFLDKSRVYYEVDGGPVFFRDEQEATSTVSPGNGSDLLNGDSARQHLNTVEATVQSN
ncbi:hypothetical protein AAVH_07741 [Aphelenchoides avenae]|nr:hypothetical protein AAVH_07741 [Aphelenchus avenae]